MAGEHAWRAHHEREIGRPSIDRLRQRGDGWKKGAGTPVATSASFASFDRCMPRLPASASGDPRFLPRRPFPFFFPAFRTSGSLSVLRSDEVHTRLLPQEQHEESPDVESEQFCKNSQELNAAGRLLASCLSMLDLMIIMPACHEVVIRFFGVQTHSAAQRDLNFRIQSFRRMTGEWRHAYPIYKQHSASLVSVKHALVFTGPCQ